MLITKNWPTYKIGDRVTITSGIFHLNHRKNRNGRITSVNGDYIMVKPMWCKWEVELYPCEIKPCERIKK